MAEASKELYVLYAMFGSGLLAYLIKEVILPLLKDKSNDAITRIKLLEKFEKETDLKLNGFDFRLKNIEGDMEILTKAWQESNKAVNELVKTINSFDSNSNTRHEEMKRQNAEIREVLESSNKLIEETTKINTELLGFLKGQSKR